MPDFTFLKNAVSKKWVISAPRRAKRPDVANGTEPACPFCTEHPEETELYRVPASDVQFSGISLSVAETERLTTDQLVSEKRQQTTENWSVRVVPNKFPFAPIHELIINTPDHHTSFDSFSLEQIQMIMETYRHRFNEHHHAGQVYIFHNHGEKAGESIPHSHTQLAVVPEKVFLDIPRLQSVVEDIPSGLITKHFTIFCPTTSVWPDEVWVAPKVSGRLFGEITDDEIGDFSGILSSLTKIFDLRYNKDFPYNFYLYPGGDWYFRMVPRLKTLGGFEVGTNVFVNTQKPQETMQFVKEHFKEPNIEKIMKEHQAQYHRTV